MTQILIINTVSTEKNGITNVIFNYLQNFNDIGIRFDLVSLNTPEDYYIKEVEKQGGRLYVLPRLHGTIKYWNSLRNVISNNRYHAVHIHGNSHTTILELTAAKAAGCNNRIVHSHNTTCNSVVVHKLLAPLFNIFCTQRLACGVAAGKWMFGNKPFLVINNGVDTEKFRFNSTFRRSIRSQLNIKGDELLIGHVGLFNNQKNHSYLIDVFHLLYSKHKNYKLCLLGDGPNILSIRTKVQKLHLDDVVFFEGAVNNVNEYLSAFDLILMPSLYEGLPLSLIEQQANGLKCVVSDTITAEVDKTGNLSFVSLNAPLTEWVTEIRRQNTDNRELASVNAIHSITLAGYDIKEEANKLKDFYLQLK